MAEAVLTFEDLEQFKAEKKEAQRLAEMDSTLKEQDQALKDQDLKDQALKEQSIQDARTSDVKYTLGYTGEVWNINGTPYYTSQEFAKIINLQTESVRQLTYRGNQIRRLKSMKVGQQIFIPCAELHDYSFTTAGGGFTTYHYTKEGEIVVE